MKKIILIIFCSLLAFSFAGSAYAKKKITKPSEKAVYHNNRGVKFLADNNLTLAELEFKTAAELSPDYTEAYNNLGIVAKKRGSLDAAKVYFEKVLELDPSYSLASSHLSMVYLDEGNMDKALALGKVAAKKGSIIPVTHYNLALVYLAKSRVAPGKDYAQFAEKELKVATELDPNMFEAHLTLARLYREQGSFELSAIRYRLALETHPMEPEAWSELAEVYRTMGDYPKAENAANKAISIAGGSVASSNPHMELGRNMLDKKDYEKAVEELKLAVASEPDNEIAYYTLGSAYIKIADAKLLEGNKATANENYKAGINALGKALALNPMMANASYNLGYAYFRMDDLSSAEKSWVHTISIDAFYPPALYNLGMLYKSKKDTADSVKYLCKFISAAGSGYVNETQNATNMVAAQGGKCQS